MECAEFALSEYQKEELKFVFDLFGPKNGKICIESARNLLMKLEDVSERQQYLTNPNDKITKSEPNSPECMQDIGITPFVNIANIASFPNGNLECSFEEFAKMYEEILSQNSLDDMLANAFTLFDVKKNGMIDSKDLQKVAEVLGESIQNEEESKRLIDTICPGYKNGICLKDFKEFFIKDIKNDENNK